jgi:AcrR family transcriptional regulator
MLDSTPRDRIIAAALDLAASRPWRQVLLADIAQQARVTLEDLRQNFAGKTEILSAFVRAVDGEVLRRARERAPDQTARDTLFEVVMDRFDVLRPYRAALKSITQPAMPDPMRLGSLLSSQRWMLEAAGISTEGPAGLARIAGLSSVYASVFQIWLDDDDAGMARTMAALDRRLRQGEAALQRMDDVCAGACRMANAIGGLFNRGAPRQPEPDTAAPGAGPV